MVAPYDIREDAEGWSIVDHATGAVALVNGVTQTSLGLEDADDLLDLLNRLEEERRAAGSH